MGDYIQAWQCIGCGRIEAPQTCIGVCRDRRVFFIGRDDHEAALAAIERLRERALRASSMLQRFACATPREGQWETSWHVLRAQVREALALLAPDAESGPGHPTDAFAGAARPPPSPRTERT